MEIASKSLGSLGMNKSHLFAVVVGIIMMSACVQQSRIERRGNSYSNDFSAEINNTATISNEFSYSHELLESDLSFDVFKNKQGAVVLVEQCLHCEYEKPLHFDTPAGAIQIKEFRGRRDTHRDFKIFVSKEDTMEYGSINMIMSTTVKGLSPVNKETGWYNTLIIYIEPLPQNHRFSLWSTTELEDKTNYTGKFEKRAREAVPCIP